MTLPNASVANMVFFSMVFLPVDVDACQPPNKGFPDLFPKPLQMFEI